MSNNDQFDYKKFQSELSVEVSDQVSGFHVTLKGLSQIASFFEKEQEFWNQSKNKGGYLGNILSHFDNCVAQLKRLQNSLTRTTEQELRHNWGDIERLLSRKTTEQNDPIFYSKTPEGKFLYEKYQENVDKGNATYSYLIRRKFSITSFDHLEGYLEAYEFQHQKNSQFIQRRKEERKVLSDLRNQWEQKTQDLSHEFETQKLQFFEWHNKFIAEHDEWQKAKENAMNSFMETKEQKFKDLEKVYTEKLKLEGPVKFWQERIKKYRKQGVLWASLLSIVIISIIILLTAVLYDLPEAFQAKLFDGDPKTIKGLLILATVITFSAYLARTFSKLTFSSFHLLRDAEEREQLTMVYLALVKEGKISEKEEINLVLQSLFSRVETGLIGKDSTPSMPGLANILEQILSKK